MTGTDPHAHFKGVKPVEERHRLDEAALARWLEANVEGFAGPLTINQFKGGQSNPTYQLVTPAKKYVLRKKPAGKLLPSAHAVDREYRVIVGALPDWLSGRAPVCAVHGRQRARRDVLRDGDGGRAACSGTARCRS